MTFRKALFDWRAAISIALLVLFAPANAVHGQAAAGHGIPDPISTTELLRYADRLGLSDQQRQALTPFHDEYVAGFRALREGEIDRFIDEMQQRGGRAAPGSDLWQQLENRRNAILSQIRALDESLFSDIETILTDEQRDRMPRVRMARQRLRLMPMAHMMMTMVQVVDLSDIALDVDMSGSERERIDPFLAQYEQRLTRAMERIPAIVVAVRQEMNAAVEEIQREMQEDAVNHREVSERMMARNHEAQLPAQEHGIGMRALGRRTLFEITPHLSDRSARQLRARFISRAYGGNVWNQMRSYVEAALDGLLDRDDLDDHVRERVTDLASQTWRRNEAIFREALAEVDERDAQRTIFNRMQHGHDDDLGFQRRVREKVRAVEDPVIEELLALLPQEAFDGFAQSLPAARRPAGAPQPPADSAAAERASRAAQERAAVMGGLVPAEISDRDVAEYVRCLGIDPEQREIVQDLHERYSARVAESAAPARSEIVRFYSPEHGDPAEFVARNAQYRSRAISAIEEADQRFFDGLLEAFPDHVEAIDRLRLTRKRHRYTISPMARMWIMSSPRRFETGASDIDLSRLAQQQNVDVAGSPEADEILLEYERDLTQMLRETFEATIELSDLSTLSMGLFMLRDQSPDDGREDRAAAREAQREAERRLAEAESAIAQLNGEVMDELVATLPDRDGPALLSAYRERALPQVYRDPGAMEEILSRTLQMDDLNPSQRDSIAELLAEYRAEYANLTSQMHEVAERQQLARAERERGDAQPGSAMRLHEEFEKLRHDRQELNARAILNLEGVLNETQLARLGPMPDPTRRPPPRMWN